MIKSNNIPQFQRQNLLRLDPKKWDNSRKIKKNRLTYIKFNVKVFYCGKVDFFTYGWREGIGRLQKENTYNTKSTILMPSYHMTRDDLFNIYYYIENESLFIKMLYRDTTDQEFDERICSIHRSELKRNEVSFRAFLEIIEKKMNYPEGLLYYINTSGWNKLYYSFYSKFKKIIIEYMESLNWYYSKRLGTFYSYRLSYKSGRFSFLDNYIKK